ncbi:HpaII family restriction endonuclease [Sphingobacterium sp. T2]|uniref:HpaII family restriction endonuclease n=1 Tax=Sphingobacterium sp. T2 TaxID=1590596 RepID=UPI00057BBAF8|nr:HpaII family restriction endonuclease [Sphingobacterium sp. T2]
MLTGNKGEWSEIYALFKVISDKVLFGGDSNLHKIEKLIFPIIKVLRDESNGTFDFTYENDLVLVKNNDLQFRISVNEFGKQAHFLLRKLQERTNATFSIPEVEQFMNSFNSCSLKAKSSVKRDIRIVIYDHRTGTNPELGFSIKSQLGGASTLLNAGRTTNFIYRIQNLSLSDEEIDHINAIESKSKIKDRIERLSSLNGAFSFERTENPVFQNNLILIDSALPKILSEVLLSFFTTNFTRVSDLVSEITRKNPLNYNMVNSHPYYSYKIKRFLTDIALGMMPSKVWTGELDATGGYLVVKENGDVLCYHIYNRNEFEDYLFCNTKLETPSSTRHGFGSVYNEDGKLYFKLSLQIRFL